MFEPRFGLDAIEIGSQLMEGRRVTGRVLSGLLASVTNKIGQGMQELVAVKGGWGWERAVMVMLCMCIFLCWRMEVTSNFILLSSETANCNKQILLVLSFLKSGDWYSTGGGGGGDDAWC